MGTRTVTLKPEGLGTDPGELVDVPKGAMRLATNCVIRRNGMVGPRPGFELPSQPAPSNAELRCVIPFAGGRVFFAYDTVATSWVINATGSVTPPPDFAPPDPDRIAVRSVEARGSLYFTHQGGVAKLEGLGATATKPAGLYPPRLVAEWTTNQAGDAIPTDSAVAYRAVLVREDANGYKVSSFPSNRRIARNTLGSTRDYLVQIGEIPDAAEGDIIEIYRSRPTAAATDTPEDELYLAVEHTLTASDVTALQAAAPPYNKLTFYDSTPDGYLGRALYTNPSQEGLAASNLPPPACHDMVLFKGSMFYFRLSIRPRFRLTLGDLGGTYIEGLYNDTGFKVMQFTGDLSSGSPTITNVSGADVGKMRPGMSLADGSVIFADAVGTFIPANTFITGLDAGAGTVTMSKNATGSAAARSLLQAHDTISIGITTLHAQPTFSNSQSGFHVRGDSGSTTLTQQMGRTVRNLAEAINALVPDAYAFVEELDGGSDAALIIESTAEDGEDFVIGASVPEAFMPTLNYFLSSERESQPGGFAWSKTDRPEAVPVTNYAYAGDPEAKILRAVGTRDAVWLFKEDGLYRLSGLGATSGWRVDPIDYSLVLLAPNSVAVLEEAVYAWCNRGVVVFGGGEGGIVTLSSPFIGTDLEAYEADLAANAAESGVPCGVAHLRAREYMLSVGNSGESGSLADAVYVWSSKTKAWVKWARSPKFLAYDPVLPGLLEVFDSDYELHSERVSGLIHTDRSHSITVSDVDGQVLTLVTGDWYPNVGDMITVGGERVFITQVNSGTEVVVAPTKTLSTGAATALERIQCVVEFVAEVHGQPDAVKTWSAVQWLFQSTAGISQIEPAYLTDRDLTPSSETLPLGEDSEQQADAPRQLPHWVPRDQAWAQRIYPRLTVYTGGDDAADTDYSWLLEGVALEAEVEGTQQRRTVA